MLGTDIGKKVTAGVVQDQYNEFLKNKNKTDKKKTQTPEERKLAKREEMRKRGIMVKADDDEEAPTLIEHGDGTFRPYVLIIPEKPVKWKHKKRKSDNTKLRSKTDMGTRVQKTKKDKSKSPYGKIEKSTKSETDDPSSIKKKSKRKRKEEKSEASGGLTSESSDHSIQPTSDSKKYYPPAGSAEVVEDDPNSKNEKKPEGSTPIPTAASPVPAASNKPTTLKTGNIELDNDDKKSGDKLLGKTENEEKSSESGRGSVKMVLTGSATDLSAGPANDKVSVPKVEKQANAFEMLDDEEFEKIAVSSSVMSDADEKEILKIAHKLLKVAKQHKALEKCLTPAENEILAKFFSGKQPLTPEVLAVLDGALDKIIDYLEKNKCELDEETKKVLKRRNHLKAAMMKEFLFSPQYLPKQWTQKFNQWKAEAAKKKFGIDWFKILFEYPKHKGFGDGPEDSFGNFKRKHRHWLIGIFIGPNDVKSFEETKRESDCQGMFLDTKLIERAGTEPSTMSIIENSTKKSSKSDKK